MITINAEGCGMSGVRGIKVIIEQDGEIFSCDGLPENYYELLCAESVVDHLRSIKTGVGIPCYKIGDIKVNDEGYIEKPKLETQP